MIFAIVGYSAKDYFYEVHVVYLYYLHISEFIN